MKCWWRWRYRCLFPSRWRWGRWRYRCLFPSRWRCDLLTGRWCCLLTCLRFSKRLFYRALCNQRINVALAFFVLRQQRVVRFFAELGGFPACPFPRIKRSGVGVFVWLFAKRDLHFGKLLLSRQVVVVQTQQVLRVVLNRVLLSFLFCFQLAPFSQCFLVGFNSLCILAKFVTTLLCATFKSATDTTKHTTK